MSRIQNSRSVSLAYALLARALIPALFVADAVPNWVIHPNEDPAVGPASRWVLTSSWSETVFDAPKEPPTGAGMRFWPVESVAVTTPTVLAFSRPGEVSTTHGPVPTRLGGLLSMWA